jgi:hypothetical protein
MCVDVARPRLTRVWNSISASEPAPRILHTDCQPRPSPRFRPAMNLEERVTGRWRERGEMRVGEK